MLFAYRSDAQDNKIELHRFHRKEYFDFRFFFSRVIRIILVLK